MTINQLFSNLFTTMFVLGLAGTLGEATSYYAHKAAHVQEYDFIDLSKWNRSLISRAPKRALHHQAKRVPVPNLLDQSVGSDN